MQTFLHWMESYIAHLGYPEIFFLMALESSLFPVPSEAVMIPAGYLAARGELDPWLATLAGGLGSLAGASANYVLGRYAGRAFLLRWGKYLLIDERRYHDAEALFLRNARAATFIGRFIPVVRHLISLPAGTFGMALLPFALLTTLGATIWCGILVLLGYHFGEPAVAAIHAYSTEFGVLACLLIGAYVLHKLARPRRGAAS